MKKLFYLIPLFLILVISGCTQQSQMDQVDSSNTSQLYDLFVEKLSKCEAASLRINAKGTDDLYNIEVLGLNQNNCEIKLVLEKAGKTATKQLEGLYSICKQTWREDFKVLSELKDDASRDYVNNLLINLVLEMNKENSLCEGSLRDKILEVGK